jgi:NAD(P)H dehydrogenase (quinone)
MFISLLKWKIISLILSCVIKTLFFMNILVILAHPAKESFNHSIASVAVAALQKNGYKVYFHDLYAEMFDPILNSSEIPQKGIITSDIENHCNELISCDGLVIIHPNWWGQPPAILKGWIDRVIRPGVAYKFQDGDSGEGIPVGLLKAKTAIIFNTSNTSEKRENDIFGDPLELIWKNCIFNLCGIKNFYRKMFRIVVTSSKEIREEWLEEVRYIIENYFPRNNIYKT